MTKAEYIERHGVEAYEEHKKIMKAYQQANKEQVKEYHQAHKEQVNEYKKKYYQTHKEQIAEQRKEYYQSNKERIAEYNKEYCQDNKESLAMKRKEWYEANKEQILEKAKDYYSTPLGKANYLVNAYNAVDRKKGFDTSNNVDRFWVVDNIFSGQKCIYCGENNWERLGCDRIDNSKPHTADNIVCSCGFCNKVRRNRYSVEEFKKRCDKN